MLGRGVAVWVTVSGGGVGDVLVGVGVWELPGVNVSVAKCDEGNNQYRSSANAQHHQDPSEYLLAFLVSFYGLVGKSLFQLLAISKHQSLLWVNLQRG